MSKDTITIEKGIINPAILKKKLLSMRFKLVLPSIIFLIVYLFLIYMNFYDLKSDSETLLVSILMIICVGEIVVVIIREFKPDCIYKFKIESSYIRLFLINTLGKKRSLSIPIDQIDEVEYQNKGFWTRHGKVWIHFVEHVEEYYFISDELGEELANNINTNEKKN